MIMSTNSKKLTGKVAVVPGASKGIGAAIAKLPNTLSEKVCLAEHLVDTPQVLAD